MSKDLSELTLSLGPGLICVFTCSCEGTLNDSASTRIDQYLDASLLAGFNDLSELLICSLGGRWAHSMHYDVRLRSLEGLEDEREGCDVRIVVLEPWDKIGCLFGMSTDHGNG